jgi:hypothetical protein
MGADLSAGKKADYFQRGAILHRHNREGTRRITKQYDNVSAEYFVLYGDGDGDAASEQHVKPNDLASSSTAQESDQICPSTAIVVQVGLKCSE